jgi:hypothetical protein
MVVACAVNAEPIPLENGLVLTTRVPTERERIEAMLRRIRKLIVSDHVRTRMELDPNTIKKVRAEQERLRRETECLLGPLPRPERGARPHGGDGQVEIKALVAMLRRIVEQQDELESQIIDAGRLMRGIGELRRLVAPAAGAGSP